jgi:hypothetical protein
MSLPRDVNKGFANFDPQYCRAVARVAAAVSAVLILCAIIILSTIDPTATRCPGWLIFAENGTSGSMWLFIAIVAPAGACLCFMAVNWNWFSQRMFDKLNSAEQTLMSDGANEVLSPKERHDTLTVLLTDINVLFTMVYGGLMFFCAVPLVVIAAKCA